jgi:hypothetical protein
VNQPGLELPENLDPTNPVMDLGNGNSVTWTSNGPGSFTLEVTLAPGQTALHFDIDASHSGSGNNTIDAHQTLTLAVEGVSPMANLAHDVDLAGAGDKEFLLVDSQWQTVVDSAHFTEAEANALAGWNLYQADGSGNPVDVDDAGKHVILGTDDPDTIYAGSGDSILVGGAGEDTFAWNNDNMQGGTSTIKDFTLDEDALRFEDLFGGGGNGMEALEDLLSKASGEDTWEYTGSSATNGVFSFGPDGATTIELSTLENALQLKVSYTDDTVGDRSQTVVLQGQDFTNVGEVDLTDAQAAMTMLQEIMKIS